jgi:hypothetical protein
MQWRRNVPIAWRVACGRLAASILPLPLAPCPEASRLGADLAIVVVKVH